MTVSQIITKQSAYATHNILIQQVLEAVTAEFTNDGFLDIVHGRLSIESSNFDLNELISSSYEGLSKACIEHQYVMIKWSLVHKSSMADCRLINALKNLEQLAKINKQTETDLAIIPILSRSQKNILFNQQQWQLTICVMPYYKLGSLKGYLINNTLTHTQKLSLIMALAKVLSKLHEAGWVHGDIKPSNFLIQDLSHESGSGTGFTFSVCLNDFGCALPINSIGMVKYEGLRGTPAYLAPECWQDNKISIQSDIYAFGVTVFEIFMGKRPFSIGSKSRDRIEDRSRAWAMAHCQEAIPLLIDEWQIFQPIIDKVLAKNTAYRFQQMSQFLMAFDPLVSQVSYNKKV